MIPYLPGKQSPERFGSVGRAGKINSDSRLALLSGDCVEPGSMRASLSGGPDPAERKAPTRVPSELLRKGDRRYDNLGVQAQP